MSTIKDSTNVELAPHAIQAEEAVLGAILGSPNAIYEVMPFLQADDFWVVRNGWIWDVMVSLTLRRDPVDYLTVASELKQQGRLEEAGGTGYLIDITMRTPSALNVEGYGRIVERMALRRRLIDAAGKVAHVAHSDDKDIEDVISEANEAVASVTDRHVATVSKARGIDSVVADVQMEACEWRDDPQEIRGLACGLYPIDIATGGLQPGLLYEIAARPGSGKSAAVARFVWGLAFQGLSVVVMSLEMSDRAIVRRMAVQISKVNATSLKEGKLTPEEFQRFMAAGDKLAYVKDNILIETRSGLTVNDMKAVVTKHQREHNVSLVIIDTMNRVGSKGKDQYERTTLVSHAIADWAHNSPFPILAAVQLSRVNQQTTNKRPTLSSLRDSGAVEEDADWIGGLHREWQYANTEELRAQLRNEGRDHLAELIVLKARDGDADIISEMYWSPETVSFERIDKHSVDLNAPDFVMGRDNR